MLRMLSHSLKPEGALFPVVLDVNNLGIGLGGIASSLVVTSGKLSSFQMLYWIDSITYLIYFVFAITLPKWVGQRLNKEDQQSGSYREVFAFDRFWAIGSGKTFALGAMYAAYDSLGTAGEIAELGVNAGAEFDKSSALPCQLISFPMEQ